MGFRHWLKIGSVFLLVSLGLTGKTLNASSLSGNQLLVDDRPYQIRGVTFSYARPGDDRKNIRLATAYIGAEVLDGMLRQMASAGINTVRTYFPPEGDLLDALFEYRIRVIVGFPYRDDRYSPGPDILGGGYLDYIRRYRAHPAVLFWELGNEYNDHPEWFAGNVANWYNFLEQAATRCHRADPDHPVSTANLELPDARHLAACPSVDIWGMNVYRWDNPEALFSEWKNLSDKPMYISESGADAFHHGRSMEAEEEQARAVANIWMDIHRASSVQSPAGPCLGVTFMSFIDEWWKSGTPHRQDTGGFPRAGMPYDGFANEEYWGWTRMDHSVRKVLTVMGSYWK